MLVPATGTPHTPLTASEWQHVPDCQLSDCPWLDLDAFVELGLASTSSEECSVSTIDYITSAADSKSLKLLCRSVSRRVEGNYCTWRDSISPHQPPI